MIGRNRSFVGVLFRFVDVSFRDEWFTAVVVVVSEQMMVRCFKTMRERNAIFAAREKFPRASTVLLWIFTKIHAIALVIQGRDPVHIPR